MSGKKTHIKHDLRVFGKECKEMKKDIFFTYKNFIHWSISRVIISVWGIILGLLVALPIFLLAILSGSLDGIAWLDIVKYSLTGEDPAHSGLIAGVASHPYALVFMVAVIFASILAFVLGNMYAKFLLSRLSFKYIGKKKLAYKNNLYFSVKYITTFLALFCWNTVYVLSILFIGASFFFALYIIHVGGGISFTLLSFLGLGIMLIFIALVSYVSYRIMFGYVILANTQKHHKLKPARYYLKKSIKITKGKSFLKFLAISILYAAIIMPFQSGETYMEDKVIYLKDVLAFKTGVVGNIASEDVKYYEYLSKEYDTFTNEEIVDKIVFISRLRIIYFFLTYFLISGSFVLIMTSFYKRVLIKK